MGAKVLREEGPKWVEIMEYLVKHGARTGPGCRRLQSVIAKDVGLGDRCAYEFLKSMESYGILKVRRTTIDGSFGSPRGPNIYHLTCTVEDWVTRLGPAAATDRRARLRARNAAQARNWQRERRRERLEAKLDALGPPPTTPPVRSPRSRPPRVAPAAAAPVSLVPGAEEIEALAAAYDDDEALAGW